MPPSRPGSVTCRLPCKSVMRPLSTGWFLPQRGCLLSSALWRTSNSRIACVPCGLSSPSSARTDGRERCWRMPHICARVRKVCTRMIRATGSQMRCTPDWAHDRDSLEDRLYGVGLGRSSMWRLLRGEWLFALVCELAAAVRDFILQRSSRPTDARIHVSPMSVAWLQLHETEYDKHRSESWL